MLSFFILGWRCWRRGKGDRRWFVILKDNHSPSATVIMLGNFQQSQLRIEVEASETAIRDSLLRPVHLQQWLWPQRCCRDARTAGSGLAFTSWTGPVAIHHQVEVATPNCLRLLVKELTVSRMVLGRRLGAIAWKECQYLQFGSNAQFAASASVLTTVIWHFWKTLIQ